MTNNNLHKSVIYSVLFLFLFCSCSQELDTETFDDKSLVTVKLQGTPSQLSRVNIEILDVQIRVLEDETNPNAWLSLTTMNTGIHDLTLLTNYEALTLVEFEEIPTGFIYNIKLVLGDQNSAVNNAIEYELIISPEQGHESINIVEKQLHANKLYDFLIEFDVDGSVELTTEGATLHPKMNTLLRRYELF